MIDRTTFDLRIAEHSTTTARINARDWQRQGQEVTRPVRAALASALVALARRLSPSLAPHGLAGQEQPAA